MPHSSVTVREALRSDVPEITELVREVLAEFGLVFGIGSKTDEEVTRLPDSYVDHGGAFWVATDSTNQVIGSCGVFPIDETTLEVRKMYLYPRARGQGAAQLLMDVCVDFARNTGKKKLVLDTIHQMDRAITFYEKNGFVRDDSQIRGARCTRGYIRHLI
jgi:putative acetyltransferase